MKYTYIYKTSDGVRHEASMKAESREAVFLAMRAQGVKPIKVIAADGSKANGEIRGVRKRMVFLAVVVAVILTGTVAYFFTKFEAPPMKQGEKTIAQPLPRQVIMGNRKRVEAAYGCFSGKAEAFLARFAEPGRPFEAPECDWPKKADFEAALSKSILFGDDEFTEQIDLKRIVAGLKREYFGYAQAGGLVSGYIRELINRQNTEIEYRNKCETQLKQMVSRRTGTPADQKLLKDAYDYWVKVNAQLQSMGIYPIELPYVLEGYQGTPGF